MSFEDFESRKRDHLRLAMEDRQQARGGSGLERIELIHRGLPELDLQDVRLETPFFGRPQAAPFFISSMTAGHEQGLALNIRLATIAAARRWPMGLGSQRRELESTEARRESRELRKHAPGAVFFANLGLAQVINAPPGEIQRVVDALEAQALIVHLNPLQEAIQPEGTPQFRGGMQALAKLRRSGISCPLIVKETGCGLSAVDIALLVEAGVDVIDVSGYGGTHWGRIEGDRAKVNSVAASVAKTFAFWGVSTLDSLEQAIAAKANGAQVGIWASGGIRSGLDAAKALALGASAVGFAQPVLAKLLEGDAALLEWMDTVEQELRVALFCTGAESPVDLCKGKRWRKI